MYRLGNEVTCGIEQSYCPKHRAPMPAFISHWLSAERAHAWPWATTPKKELARPATEAVIANWAAELLAYVGSNAGR